METWEWIVLGVAAAALLLLVLALVRIRRRRAHLKDRFGPEYDRAVSGDGTGTAETRLSAVEREHDELDIKVLPSAARDRYLDEWRQAEARFVSDPRDAARAAERLVERALEERGYPNGDFERQLALVSVDHPEVVERYRHGRSMVEGHAAERTEDLRKAMIDFRTVLEDCSRPSPRLSDNDNNEEKAKRAARGPPSFAFRTRVAQPARRTWTSR